MTDRCNMRCMYCMPRGNVRWFNEQDVLDYREISRLVSILANLGVENTVDRRRASSKAKAERTS